MASTAIRNDLYRGAWGVVEIDFRSYFTTIPHDQLIILIKQRVVDGSMLRLIKQSLTVGIAYEGKVVPTTVGICPVCCVNDQAFMGWFCSCFWGWVAREGGSSPSLAST